jgi:hypothetical protein
VIQAQTVSILRQEVQLLMVLVQLQLLKFIHMLEMHQPLVLEHPTTQRCTTIFEQDKLPVAQPREILYQLCILELETQALMEHPVAA